MIHFDFFKLPLDIQLKILQEYISEDCKKTILIHIPQFIKLLMHSESWSKNQLSLSRCFQLINLSKQGYFLDFETEKHLILIKFNFKMQSLDLEYFEWKSEEYQPFNICLFKNVNLTDISNILKKFYDTHMQIVNFETDNQTYVAPYKKIFIIVNYQKKFIKWIDKRFYSIEKCCKYNHYHFKKNQFSFFVDGYSINIYDNEKTIFKNNLIKCIPVTPVFITAVSLQKCNSLCKMNIIRIQSVPRYSMYYKRKKHDTSNYLMKYLFNTSIF